MLCEDEKDELRRKSSSARGGESDLFITATQVLSGKWRQNEKSNTVAPYDSADTPVSSATSWPQGLGTFRLVSDVVSTEWPEVPFVVRDWGLGPGTVNMLVGYGFSGKTLLAQHMALCVATGRPLLGKYEVRKGRVVHLDLEQGERESGIRYRRLATGHGIDWQAFAAIGYAEFPPLRLEDEDAEATLKLAAKGFDLMILDSFRAAVRGDENDSGIRHTLDSLTRVSNATGCTILVLHHEGKRSGKRSDERQSARGNSGIFDAVGTMLQLTSEKDGSVSVTQTKNRSIRFGGARFRIEDVGAVVPQIGRTEGLKFCAFDGQPILPAATARERVIAALRKNGRLGASALKKAASGRAEDVQKAREALVAEGLVDSEKVGKQTIYFLPSSSASPAGEPVPGNDSLR
ncbi:MAG: hypothetical protein V7645_3055 [Actinomycetota bacterium]|jgi:hypothetical protein